MRKQKPRHSHLLILLTAILVAALGTRSERPIQAQTPTPVSACGIVTGSVVLVQDISTTNLDCLIVDGPDTTIDGASHTITINSNGHAIVNLANPGLTVRNVSSNSGVLIDGDSADNDLIENSVLSEVTVKDADDVTIRNNTLGQASLGADGFDTLGITFTGNTVRGNASRLVTIKGSGISPCALSGHTIANNTLISDHVCTSNVDCNEPTALQISCSSGSTYDQNTITASSKAQGIRLINESDNNTFSGNTVRVHDPDSDYGALNITTGSLGLHTPRNNTFIQNFFQSDFDLAINIQSAGYGNRFSFNTFWTNTFTTANNLLDGPNANTWDHNTFYNSGSGPAILLNYPNNRMADDFTNNIIATTGTTAVKTASGSGWSFSRYTGNNNLFWSTTAGMIFSPTGSLNSWKDAAVPSDQNSQYNNPLFENPSIGIFALLNGSPARAMGTDGTDVGANTYRESAVKCTESWYCDDWSPCINNQQSRNCIDLQSCGTAVNRPPRIQSCTDVPAPDASQPAAITNLLAF